MATVLAIRHVKIEHLGSFEDSLKKLGFNFKYLDTPKGGRLKEPLENYQALFILGGYMGAYEEEKYKFLGYEFRLIEEALNKKIPLLGICLGAQMLAKVLGAKIYPGKRGKEIGWVEVEKIGDHPYFSDFPKTLKVFQWHEDTFDLPSGALKIFSSLKYENQGFVYERAVALQFHIEVDKKLAKVWAKEYREELEQEGIPFKIFKEITEEENQLLKKLSFKFIERFLGLEK